MHFRIEQTSAASPRHVYDVLLDVERWPDWMAGVRKAKWEKRGAPGTGVGGVRRFGGRGVSIREEVIAGQPPERHSYSILSGVPVKNHRGDVHIDHRPDGSQITWDVRFESRIPLFSKIVRHMLRSTIKGGAAALALEAQRRAELEAAI